MGVIVSAIIMTIFPSVRAWIDGGSKGVKDYNKQKRDNYQFLIQDLIMGLFDKFKYDGDTLFRLQHILKSYKNETPINRNDEILMNAFIKTLLIAYKAERKKAPEFGREIIDKWISLLENDSKIIIDYLKNNLQKKN